MSPFRLSSNSWTFKPRGFGRYLSNKNKTWKIGKDSTVFLQVPIFGGDIKNRIRLEKTLTIGRKHAGVRKAVQAALESQNRLCLRVSLSIAEQLPSPSRF